MISPWLVKAWGGTVGDGVAVGLSETLTGGVTSGDACAVADSLGVGDGVADCSGARVWVATGVPPDNSSARVGPTLARKSATSVRRRKRIRSVLDRLSWLRKNFTAQAYLHPHCLSI